MSKAFLKESDFEIPEAPLARVLPEGNASGQISITPEGAARLRAELVRLSEVERPALAGRAELNVDERTELQGIDQRIRELVQSLRVAQVIPAPTSDREVVRLGAYVRVRDTRQQQSQYRIVGVLETELEEDWVSWESPLGRALLNGRVGERVKFQAPRGEIILDIVSVSYP